MSTEKKTTLAPKFTKPERIEIDNPLKDKIRIVANMEAVEKENIARAETAIQTLSVQFDEWLSNDLLRLIKAKSEIIDHGLTEATKQKTYLASLELKGIATTFGFPLVSKVAGSLCHLIEQVPDIQKIPISVIDQHISAIAALVHEDARNQGSPVAQTLVDKLCSVTEEYIVHITKAA